MKPDGLDPLLTQRGPLGEIPVVLDRRENWLEKGVYLAEGSTEVFPSRDCKSRSSEKQCLLGPCCKQARLWVASKLETWCWHPVSILQTQELSSEECHSWPSLCSSRGIHREPSALLCCVRGPTEKLVGGSCSHPACDVHRGRGQARKAW